MASHTPVMMYGVFPAHPLEERQQGLEWDRLLQQLTLPASKADLKALEKLTAEALGELRKYIDLRIAELEKKRTPPRAVSRRKTRKSPKR